jgi:hypothetical protein
MEKEARFIEDYNAIRNYLTRILKNNEYSVWRGSRHCIIFQTGHKYPVEVGEFWLKENPDAASCLPFIGKYDNPTWAFSDCPFIRERPPTPDENEELKRELQRYRAPMEHQPMIEGKNRRTTPARLAYMQLPNLPEMVVEAEPEKIFVYWRWGNSEEDGKMSLGPEYPEKYVECIRVRVDQPNGIKKFITWTFFETGVWKPREPEGFHRLFGMAEVEIGRVGTRLFLHEGEKTVLKVRESIVNGNLSKPIDEFLSGPGIFHVGWGFGALTPQRVNWRRLARLCTTMNIKEIVIVPDNDQVGMAAVQVISRNFSDSEINLLWLDPSRFDGVKEGWDFADGIPEENWRVVKKGDKEYLDWKKPPLEVMLQTANWATRIIGEHQNGNPIYDVTRKFLEDCVHIPDISMFVLHSRPGSMMSKENMGQAVRGFSDTARIMDLYLAKNIRKAARVSFRPDRKMGLFYDDAIWDYSFNQYVDRRPHPVEGDCSVFFEFMTHLVPNVDERTHLMNWIATLFVAPHICTDYGVLLHSSTQGVGKSLLISILKAFVSPIYTSEPTDDMLIDPNYNGYAYNKLLVACHEIYASENFKAVNKMKSQITERTININQKYGAQFSADNFSKVFCCSNHEGALALDNNDRRWLVVHGTESKISEDLVKRVNAFRDGGGLSHLRWFLENHWTGTILKNGGNAPMTEAKERMIEVTVPLWAETIKELVGNMRENEIVTIPILREVAAERGVRNFPKISKLIHELDGKGVYFTPHEQSPVDKRVNYLRFEDGEKVKSKVVFVGNTSAVKSITYLNHVEGESEWKVLGKNMFMRRQIGVVEM